MVKRQIVWTETALLQRREILKYWRETNQSSVYPKKIIQLTAVKLKAISKNPLLFPMTDYLDTRVATMGNFSIFYKMVLNMLIITAFWDNRQNPDHIIDLIK